MLSWREDCIFYEADQRHAEIIIEEMKVTKSVSTPGSRDDAAKAGPPNIKCSKRAPKDHKEKYVKLFTENNFDYDETALNTEEASR